jgi:hypothetical protein
MQRLVLVTLLVLAGCERSPSAVTAPVQDAPRDAALATAASPSTLPSEAPRVDPSAPDLAKLRSLLRPHASHAFDAAARGRGCPADRTLGGYIDDLVKHGTHGDPGDTVRLTGGCTEFRSGPGSPPRVPIDPPASAEHWSCRIDAYASDAKGESPWHYELRLRVRKRDLAPDLVTLACPGAP